jgi:hypothetical protein
MKLLLLLLSFSVFAAQQGPVIVGNGDDGTDLQSFTPITEGPIVESRKKAVALLKKYELQTIEGLGSLIPEVENTKMYMTKKGLSPQKLAELGAFTADATGLIYARTMPEPYSSTRFFPAATGLNEKQLISLHIHEALHRSLPSDYREDEDIASGITQAITSPDTSRDKIAKVVKRFIGGTKTNATAMTSKQKLYVPQKSRLRNPSRFGLEARVYDQDKDDKMATTESGINTMYLLRSHLYPFGENENAIGLGFDASIIKTDNDTFMGPLSLSGRSLVYTKRDFDIELFAQLNLNTLSDEELKSSLLGRDTTRFGITLATRRDYFYIENDFTYTLQSNVEEEFGGIKYTYTFGDIYGVNLRAGTRFGNLMIGGFAEILLSDNFIISSEDEGEIDQTGRNRVISWGPHIEYRRSNYSIGVKGRFMLDSTKNTSYDYLSDLMGYGVGQGSLSTQFNVFF